jgi:TP901 family phage tail tape measure protein
MANTTTYRTFDIKDLLSKGLEKLEAGMAKLDAAFNRTDKNSEKAMGGVNNAMRRFQRNNIQALNSIQDEIPGASRAVELLSNPYAAATAATVALGAGALYAFDKHNQFDKALAHANVTLGLNKTQLGAVKGELEYIAAHSYVENINEVPDALNKIVSSGANLPTAMRLLDPTLKAAKAGFTDVETTAAAAMAVMQSSGLTNATRVYDILFATLNKGNAEFKDIAAYMPKIIPAAKSLGVPLEEAAGAFAFLTAQGNDASRSATLLENTFKTLGDPKRLQAFEKLHVPIFNASGKMRKMADIATDLSKKLDGLTDAQRIKKLSSLGLDSEAANSFATMAQNADKLRDSIDGVTDSNGAMNKALDDSMTDADKWQFAMNNIAVAVEKMGGRVAPIFNALGNELNHFLDILDNSEKGTSKKYIEELRMREMGYHKVNGFKDSPLFNSQVQDKFNSRYVKDKGEVKNPQILEQIRAEETARMGDYDGARAIIQNSPYYHDKGINRVGKTAFMAGFDINYGDDTRKRQIDEIDSYIATLEKKTAGDLKTDNKPPATTDKTANFFQDVPKGKSQKEASAGGERSNNVRNVTITIQKMYGIENVYIYGTDPNLTGVKRQVEESLTELIVRPVRDAEILLANQ